MRSARGQGSFSSPDLCDSLPISNTVLLCTDGPVQRGTLCKPGQGHCCQQSQTVFSLLLKPSPASQNSSQRAVLLRTGGTVQCGSQGKPGQGQRCQQPPSQRPEQHTHRQCSHSRTYTLINTAGLPCPCRKPDLKGMSKHCLLCKCLKILLLYSWLASLASCAPHS